MRRTRRYGTMRAFGGVAERLKAPVLKTGKGSPFVSSNLTASATGRSRVRGASVRGTLATDARRAGPSDARAEAAAEATRSPSNLTASATGCNKKTQVPPALAACRPVCR